MYRKLLFAGSRACLSSSPPWSSILTRLAKENNAEEIRRVLRRILPSPDAQHFTIVIAAHSRAGRLQEALQLFEEMPGRDLVAWNSMVKGCLDCRDLPLARRLFDQMPQRNVISWTTMMDGFARSGRIEEAEELFRNMPQRDIAAWNSMLYGYCSNGKTHEALQIFDEMPQRNIISWTTMIGGLDQNGDSRASVNLFKQMHSSGEKPTSGTFASLLTACSNVPDSYLGPQAHGLAVKLGCSRDAYVSSSLITFYAAIKLVDEAQKAFQENKSKTVVIWTALLTGYSSNGRHQEALLVLNRMMHAGIRPNQSTLTSALHSCCRLESLHEGKVLHGVAVKVGLGLDLFVGNSLIVLYSKCGDIVGAQNLFDDLPERNLVSWNSLIAGYAQNGLGRAAISVFGAMEAASVPPDEITYVGILTACSHSGMLEEGRRFFRQLIEDRSMVPKVEHFVCMVGLLCRTGNIAEGERFIMNMHLESNVAVWVTLLSFCNSPSNLEIAERAAKNVFLLDPRNISANVTMSNLYAKAGRWDDVAKTRMAIRRSESGKKNPGFSWILGSL